MNILHIIDDEKFIAFCKKTFDLKNNHNVFIKSGELSINLLESKKIETIFIHFLRKKEVDFFLKNELSIPIVWIFWGADGFSAPSFYNYFLDQSSKKFLFRIKLQAGFFPFIKHFIKWKFKPILNFLGINKKFIKVINRFNYIVPIVPGDYYLLKKKYKIIPPLFHFNYIIPLHDYDSSEKSEKNILLGNSSAITNNHVSVLEKLENKELSNRKVYVPLNYGNVEYKNHLVEYIDKMKNKNIVPIVDFMEYEEYIKIITSCSIMIMNHHRQQALGNIILGLNTGCTIYMNKNSSLYKYLILNHFIIKDIENLENLSEITNQEKIKNGKLVHEVFGETQQKKLVSELLENISKVQKI